MLKDYTSLSPSEEATFNVYEQRMQADSKKAMTLGMIVSGIFGILVVIIYFMGEADHSGWEGQEIKGDKSSMGKESKSDVKKEDKPDPAPAKEEASGTEGGEKGEAAAAGGEEAAAGDKGEAAEKAEGE